MSGRNHLPIRQSCQTAILQTANEQPSLAGCHHVTDGFMADPTLDDDVRGMLSRDERDMEWHDLDSGICRTISAIDDDATPEDWDSVPERPFAKNRQALDEGLLTF